MTINHKTFAAYAVLKAEDVNNYLMNQTGVQVTNFSELSSLPTTVKIAYVTSTGQMAVYSGSTWLYAAVPTAPAVLTPSAGWAHWVDADAGSGFDRLHIVKMANEVTIRGVLRNLGTVAVGVNTIMAVNGIPAAMRPPGTRMRSVQMGDGSFSTTPQRVDITTTGSIIMTSAIAPTANKTWVFDLSYSLTAV